MRKGVQVRTSKFELRSLASADDVRGAEAVRDAVGAHRLIALVTGMTAGGAFFFDVGDLAVRADITVASGNAPAIHCREPE